MPDGTYKPNIYPVMYWALAYGVIAGVILLVITLLAQYITIVWFPVFLAGALWGAFRNYKKQKREWHTSRGQTAPKKPVIDEFKDAVRDVISASQEVVANERAQEAAQEEIAPDQVPPFTPQEPIEEVPVAPEEPPQPPYQPPAAPQPPAPQPQDPNRPNLPNQ